MQTQPVSIMAKDGFELSGTCFAPETNPTQTVVVIDSATAVPQRFYKAYASFLAEQGFTVITYDYRGIGQSRPQSLRGFHAKAKDWALLDMAGVIDWVDLTLNPKRHIHVGHSYGGQTLGLLPNSRQVDAMITLSSQSGYWRLQGGMQKISVGFHVHLTLPVLSCIFGYMPWSVVGSAEDLPKGVAKDWSKWCRQPGYLMDDHSLPTDRYQDFQAPVLAYSFDDDAWGTKRSVDAMMKAYPNLTRRHVIPQDMGLPSIGHFGYFKPSAKILWQEAIDWLNEQVPVCKKKMSESIH